MSVGGKTFTTSLVVTRIQLIALSLNPLLINAVKMKSGLQARRLKFQAKSQKGLFMFSDRMNAQVSSFMSSPD